MIFASVLLSLLQSKNHWVKNLGQYTTDTVHIDIFDAVFYISVELFIQTQAEDLP